MNRIVYISSVLVLFFNLVTINAKAQGEVDGLAPYWRTKGNINVSSPSVPTTYGTTKILRTEHWLGTVGNKDLVIGTDSIERIRVKGTGNVGIGTANPLTTLDVKGGLAIESNLTPTACNTGTTNIVVGNRSFVRISTTATIVTNPVPTITLSNGLADGQLLTLYNESATTNVVQMANAANVKLAYSPVLIYGRTASFFVWDATNNIWFETGHVPELPRKQVYTNTGTLQVFTVPAGVKKVHVKIWGAGGGPGWYSSTSRCSGGSGGYVEGDLDVIPLQTIEVIVGDGGGSTETGRTNSGYTWGLGGGAAGGVCLTPTQAGGGGGASYLRRTGTVLAVAGGGGGGAGWPQATGTNLGYGGAGGSVGGGAAGANGNGMNGSGNANGYGRGATVAAGGAGGTGSTNNGQAGVSLQGGYGGDYAGTGDGGGGGGGGGYFGGGGGAGDNSSVYAGGGGGGSNYTGGLTGTITNTAGNVNTTGGVALAPNNADAEYLSGVGRGGYSTTAPNIIYDGGRGLIVFTW